MSKDQEERIKELERQIQELKGSKSVSSEYEQIVTGTVIGTGSEGDLAVEPDDNAPITFLDAGSYAPIGSKVEVGVVEKQKTVWFGELIAQLSETGMELNEVISDLQEQFKIPDSHISSNGGQKTKVNKSGLLKILTKTRNARSGGD